MVWFGYKNFLLDLGSFRMPSMIPLGTYTGGRAGGGALIALFAVEQLVNGWRRGFPGPEDHDSLRGAGGMSNGAIIVADEPALPVARLPGGPGGLRPDRGGAGGHALTPVSFPSMIGQLFHGIDSEALLAVPSSCWWAS